MAYIGNKPANKAVVASDLDPAVITGQTALAVAPADTDEFLISDAGVLKRLDASLVGSPGITEIDQWRLSAGLTGDQDPIATNLERVDTDGFSHLGSGMSQSSGIFTFPSTGYWDISAHFRFSSGATDNQKTGHIVTTTDNSSYSDAASCVANFYASGALGSTSTKFIFDCTNTTTHKVRFRVGTTGGSGNSVDGNTDANFTVFTFIKLANT